MRFSDIAYQGSSSPPLITCNIYLPVFLYTHTVFQFHEDKSNPFIVQQGQEGKSQRFKTPREYRLTAQLGDCNFDEVSINTVTASSLGFLEGMANRHSDGLAKMTVTKEDAFDSTSSEKTQKTNKYSFTYSNETKFSETTTHKETADFGLNFDRVYKNQADKYNGYITGHPHWVPPLPGGVPGKKSFAKKAAGGIMHFITESNPYVAVGTKVLGAYKHSESYGWMVQKIQCSDRTLIQK